MLRRSVVTVVVGLVPFLAVASPMAFGQGVGGSSPTGTSHVLDLLPPPYLEGIAIWEGTIGAPATPVPVELDASGPAWTKSFQTANGDAIIPITTSIRVYENLMVTGSACWTGWHAELAPGFLWHTGGQGVFSPPPIGVMVNGSPIQADYQVTEARSVLDASFPSLLPGTEVLFQFNFTWSGAAPFTGTFDMSQYPTPEPTTVVFMAIAATFILRRHRS